MASKLRFGGIYTSLPGAYFDVDRTGLAGFSALSTGVVALIGEAEGGGAGGGAALVSLANPQAVLRTFRGGDLKEAALIAFDPSSDSRMGGAVKVIACKVNPATLATTTLANTDGPALLVTSKDYGQFAAQINVEKDAGTLSGSSFRETLEATSNLYDNIAGSPWFTLQEAASYSTVLAQVLLDGSGNPAGVIADATIAAEAGVATGVTFVAGDAAVVACNAANNGDSVVVRGIDAEGVYRMEIGTITGAGYTTRNTWRRVTAASLIAAVTLIGSLTVSDSHANVCLTIGLGLGAVGTHTLPTLCGVANQAIVFAASGATTDPIVVHGLDAAGAAQHYVLYLAGAGSVTTAATWSLITSYELGGVPAARTVTMTSAQTFSARTTATTGVLTSDPRTCGGSAGVITPGAVASVSSSSALDIGIALTVYGLDVSGAYQTESISTHPVTGTTAVTGTKVWSVLLGAEMVAGFGTTAVGIVSVSAAAVIPIGKYRSGSTTAADAIVDLNMPVANAPVAIVLSGAAAGRKVVVEGLSTAGVLQREVVTIGAGLTTVTTGLWSKITRVLTGNIGVAIALSVVASYLIPGGISTIQQLADYAGSLAHMACTVLTSAPRTNLITELDVKVTAGGAVTRNINAVASSFSASLTELIRYVNARSSLVTLSRATAATTIPDDTAAPVYLTGGTEGVSTFANWTAALTRLFTTDEPNSIVCLSDSPAIHAALDAHLYQRETVYKREADGFVGVSVALTKTQIDAATLALNTRRLRVCAETITRYNSVGVQTAFAPYFQAALAAGMQAGAQTTSTPLTRKWINVDGIGNHVSWDPTLDGEEMVNLGVLFAEEIPNRGWRWVRNVTCYRSDDNLANCEGSVNHELNVFIRDFRADVETAIGDPNFAGTLSALRGITAASIARALTTGAIVAAKKPVFTSVGDMVSIGLEVAPTLPLNFVPVSMHLFVETTVAVG